MKGKLMELPNPNSGTLSLAENIYASTVHSKVEFLTWKVDGMKGQVIKNERKPRFMELVLVRDLFALMSFDFLKSTSKQKQYIALPKEVFLFILKLKK